ncbi:MAG: chromophore lyase CpcT/CpeT [Flavobacteriales bacterium]|nr:chromophore lyase CpcT/CpeT [Flavobacteriales bacterium]
MKLISVHYVTVVLVLFFVSSLVCAQQSVSDQDMKTLARAMAGEFSSERQSEEDSAYFNIVLRMRPIWKKRKDGNWFYVEQSVFSAQEKPYRQRIYHLYRQDDSTAVSQVYELPNPENYVLAWKNTKILDGLSIDSLNSRQGCAIYIRKKVKDIFEGSTPEKHCLSSLRGATYATSEVEILPNLIRSWDRGWDASDKQVWGAEKGPYIFVKLKKLK